MIPQNETIESRLTEEQEILINEILKQLGDNLPVYRKKVQKACKTLKQQKTQIPIQLIAERINKINRQALQNKFIQMMQDVFEAIEPQLKRYRRYNEISYLDPIILPKLDPQVYHKGYKLHKYDQTPMSQLLQDRQVDVANKLFSQLFDIMNELLTTMKVYYGYQDDQMISQALYEAIGTFIQKHEESILVQEDRMSLRIHQEQQQKARKKGKKQDQESNIDVVVDILEAISKDQKNKGGKSLMSKAGNLIGVFYKYGITPALQTVYDTVKAVNPLAGGHKLTAEEQQKLKVDLINHLKPHLSVRQPLQQKLVTYLIKLIPMNQEEILKTMGEQERNKFVTLLSQMLSDFQSLGGSFKQIVREIMNLLNKVMMSEATQSDQFYSQFIEGKWLILLYKALQKNYNPQRRRFLIAICQYQGMQYHLQNPVGILKLIQSQDLPQSPLLCQLRALAVASKNKDEKQMKLDKEKDLDINLAIQHQFHRIHLYELKKKFKEPPLIDFQKLTHCSPKRTITLLFSGFMSQDTCKIEEWEGVLDSIYDSQMYSVRWESKSYGDIFDFAFSAGKDIARANLDIGILGAIGGPYLRAIAVIRQLYKKYNNNPFNPAFQSAKATGDFLAEMLISNFKVGFSLGTQLIKHILQRLAKRGFLHLINKIYLMGGVSDHRDFQQLIEQSPCPLNIINLYSYNDSVLKYFLKLCKPSMQPIGLYPIISGSPGHVIENQDCSNVIDGHLAYRKNMKVLDKLLNLKDD